MGGRDGLDGHMVWRALHSFLFFFVGLEMFSIHGKSSRPWNG